MFGKKDPANLAIADAIKIAGLPDKFIVASLMPDVLGRVMVFNEAHPMSSCIAILSDDIITINGKKVTPNEQRRK